MKTPEPDLADRVERRGEAHALRAAHSADETEAREERGEDEVDPARGGGGGVEDEDQRRVSGRRRGVNEVPPRVVEAAQERGGDREPGGEEDHRRSDVLRERAREAVGRSGGVAHGGRDREDAPERDVLEESGSEYEAREARVEDLEVVEDARDHGNRRHRHADREHEEDRRPAARRPGKAVERKPRPGEQRREEGQRRADGEDPRGRTAVLPSEDPSRLAARDEHEQEEPQPADEAERLGCRRPGTPRIAADAPRREVPQHEGPHEHAREDLPDEPRLPQPGEEVTDGVRGRRRVSRARGGSAAVCSVDIGACSRAPSRRESRILRGVARRSIRSAVRIRAKSYDRPAWP